MSVSGLSAARLRRLHDVLTGHVESGEVPGAWWPWWPGAARSTSRPPAPRTPVAPGSRVFSDFWTCAYQAIDD